MPDTDGSTAEKPSKPPSRIVVKRRLMALLGQFWDVTPVRRIYHELWPDDPVPSAETVWLLRFRNEKYLQPEIDRQAELSKVRGLTPQSRRLDEHSRMAGAFREKLFDDDGHIRSELGIKEQEFYAAQIRASLGAIAEIADRANPVPERLGNVPVGVQYHQHTHYTQESLAGKGDAELTTMFHNLLGQMDALLASSAPSPAEDQATPAGDSSPPDGDVL